MVDIYRKRAVFNSKLRQLAMVAVNG